MYARKRAAHWEKSEIKLVVESIDAKLMDEKDPRYKIRNDWQGIGIVTYRVKKVLKFPEVNPTARPGDLVEFLYYTNGKNTLAVPKIKGPILFSPFWHEDKHPGTVLALEGLQDLQQESGRWVVPLGDRYPG